MELTEVENSFVRMLELSLLDLFAYESLCLKDDPFHFYFDVLVFYLSGNKTELRQHLDKRDGAGKPADDLHFEIAIAIAELRYLVLEKQRLQLISIEDLKKEFRNKLGNHFEQPPLLWEGEWHFVWARLHDMKKEHSAASERYVMANEAYKKIGAEKKAVKAYFNALICLERTQDSSCLHYKYLNLIQEARKVNEYSVVGMALLALSQKLLDVGALRLALEYVQRSLAFLGKERGSSNYFKALLHRSLLFYLSGQTDKARTDYQEAKLSTHAEVLSTISVLEMKEARVDLHDFHEAVLPYAWSSRLHYEKTNLNFLGFQEEQLIKILLKGPCSKSRILEKVWGPSIELDPEHIDLRFKKLMWRIKKKYPEIIAFENGLYSISSFQASS